MTQQLHAFFRSVLGSEESILRSVAAGSMSALVVWAAVVLLDHLGHVHVLGLAEFVTSRLHVAGLLLVALLLGLVMATGGSIGWLLIRPCTFLLQRWFPQVMGNQMVAWATGTMLVWLLLVAAVLSQEHTDSVQLMTGLIGVSAVALAGLIGGSAAARPTDQPHSTEWRDRALVGGVVTGSLLAVMQTLNHDFTLSVGNWGDPSGLVTSFLSRLAVTTFMGILITRILDIAYLFSSQISMLRNGAHLDHVLLAMAVWGGIGFVLAGAHPVISTLLTGLCGAGGGWAIGEFRANTADSPVTHPAESAEIDPDQTD